MLAVIVNTLLFRVSYLLSPSPLPAFLTNPANYALLQTVVLGGSIVLISVIGRKFGGQAGYGQIAAVMIWLSVVRAVIMVGLGLLVAGLPALGLLGLLGMIVIGVWITLTFVDETHGFGSLWRAAGVSVLAMLVLYVILSVLLFIALGAPSPEEIFPNV